MATKHLSSQGYKRIAAFANTTHQSKAKERIAGYKKAMDENYLIIDESWIRRYKHASILQSEVDREVSALLSLPEPPDALVVLDDYLTRAVLKSLQSKSIRIPEEIAIVGFSNSDFYELLCRHLPSSGSRQMKWEDWL